MGDQAGKNPCGKIPKGRLNSEHHPSAGWRQLTVNSHRRVCVCVCVRACVCVGERKREHSSCQLTFTQDT